MMRRWLFSGLWVLVMGFTGICAGQEKMSIGFRPSAGESFYFKTIVEQDVTRFFSGTEEQFHYTQGYGEELTVLKVNSDGTRTLRNTYRWIKYARKGGTGDEILYDSSNKEDEPIPAECLGYAALIGEGYVFSVSEDGKISNLVGIKHMRDRVRAKLPLGSLGDELMRDVKRYVDEKTVKEMLEGGFALYPQEPVAVGDKWSKQIVEYQEGGGIRDNEMTLAKVEGGIGEISVKTRFSPNPKAEPVDWGNVKAKFELTGTEKGTVKVDLKTGLGLGTKFEHEMTGYMVLINPQRPSDEVAIAMTLKGKTVVEVESYEREDEEETEEYVMGKVFGDWK